MDKKGLAKTVTEYEVTVSFFKGLLNDGNLKEMNIESLLTR